VTASASFNTEMKTELTLNLGPKSNPANLSTTESDSIYDLFTQLFRACIETQNSKNPIRFLSRYDKSAANIKESSIWTAIGQTPWSYPPSTWYHTCVDFPFRALEVTALLGEYSLVDKGTWWSVEPWIREKLMIFVRTLFHSS
jgi:ABC-type tungstate transport system permease subunit